MAYTPVTLSVGAWASPVSIVGTDIIANLDEAVNTIVTSDPLSLVNHVNTELAKLPPYLNNEMNLMYTDALSATTASALEASNSATASATSATASQTSATASEASKVASGASATASANSESASAISASASAGSATASAGSASTATTQAGNASTSATASAGSATASAGSATASASSATASAGSETASAGSASASATSATASEASATASATSALEASNSASIVDADKIVAKTTATGSAELPVGTTAQRDAVPSKGMMRFNDDETSAEIYNGTSWGSVGGGATGGGGDDVFYENSKSISANYTLTVGKNAMSAGTITIEDGVTVTVPDGATLVIL